MLELAGGIILGGIGLILLLQYWEEILWGLLSVGFVALLLVLWAVSR